MKNKTILKIGFLLLAQIKFETKLVHPTHKSIQNEIAISGEQHLEWCLWSTFGGIHHMKDVVIHSLSNNP